MGDHLGVYKDEIGNGDYIVEFFSGGPKNYGYLTKAGKSVLKIRGFTLKPKVLETLNANTIRNLINVKSWADPTYPPVRINMGRMIRRRRTDWTLYTADNIKHYKLVYDKRVVLDTLFTVPFGYL
jgi:hypothetical protein